jgi:hypothetical protein
MYANPKNSIKMLTSSLVFNTKSGVGSSSMTAITQSTLEEKMIITRAHKLHHLKCGNTWTNRDARS